MPACHAGDPGSIPGGRVVYVFSPDWEVVAWISRIPSLHSFNVHPRVFIRVFLSFRAPGLQTHTPSRLRYREVKFFSLFWVIRVPRPGGLVVERAAACPCAAFGRRARPTGVARSGHVKPVGVLRRMGGPPGGGAPRRGAVAVGRTPMLV